MHVPRNNTGHSNTSRRGSDRRVRKAEPCGTREETSFDKRTIEEAEEEQLRPQTKRQPWKTQGQDEALWL